MLTFAKDVYMKHKSMPSSSKMAWENQEKAPKGKSMGVGEYAGPDKMMPSEYSVDDSHDAYEDQDKAPYGKGMKEGSYSKGMPIEYWNKSVEKGMAYQEQCKWGDPEDQASLGFKTESEHKYMSHFDSDKILRDGHNTGSMMGGQGGMADLPEIKDRGAGGSMGPGPKYNARGPSLNKDYRGMKPMKMSKFKR